MIRRAAEMFPSLATAAYVYRRLRRSRRSFARAGADERGVRELVREAPGSRLLELVPDDLVDLRISAMPLVASQKREEIVPALEAIQALRPERICEIGTAAGGSSTS